MNIAIKLPDDLGERLLSFPFLHALNQYMQERLEKSDKDVDNFQLHLISLKSGIDVLNLLPFHAYYHELEQEDLKSIFSAHRGCSHFKITNQIDIFISTTDSFVDASIGKNFRTKEVIGFEKSFNNWFLTKKKNRPLEKHFSEQVCELVKPLLGYLSKIPICGSRELELLSSKYEDKTYFILDVDFIDDAVNPLWLELFNLAEGAHFILTSSQNDSFDQELRISTFIKSCPPKNTYELFKFSSYIDFAKLVGHAQVFTSLNSELILLAAYCRCDAIFLNQNYNFKKRGSQFLRGEVVDIRIANSLDSSGYSSCFDLILEKFEQIKAQEELSENKL